MNISIIKLKAAVFLALLFCPVFVFSSSKATAQVTGPVSLQLILPGQTQTLDVVQAEAFPLGCQHFIVGILGKGTLGVSLVKSDKSGDIIFLSGIATSSAGTFLISRTGFSKGVLSQIVEIGDDDSPYGFVWIYCGVSFSDVTPRYAYQLRLSLAP